MALHIALYQPEIPPNTGNAGRLCVAIGATLHVIHPLGFQMSSKQVRRAGLDHWPHLTLHEHADGDAFWKWAEGRTVHMFSTHGTRPHTAATYADEDVLMFGPESRGLPKDWVAKRGGYRIPMTGPVRSLNLSNSVAVVSYAAMQQIHPGLFT